MLVRIKKKKGGKVISDKTMDIGKCKSFSDLFCKVASENPNSTLKLIQNEVGQILGLEFEKDDSVVQVFPLRGGVENV